MKIIKLFNNFIRALTGENIKFEVIRHVWTAGEVAGVAFNEAWAKTTTKKVISMTMVVVDESNANDRLWAEDTMGFFDSKDIYYDGTNIHVDITGVGTTAVNDIETLLIIYEG